MLAPDDPLLKLMVVPIQTLFEVNAAVGDANTVYEELALCEQPLEVVAVNFTVKVPDAGYVTVGLVWVDEFPFPKSQT